MTDTLKEEAIEIAKKYSADGIWSEGSVGMILEDFIDKARQEKRCNHDLECPHCGKDIKLSTGMGLDDYKNEDAR